MLRKQGKGKAEQCAAVPQAALERIGPSRRHTNSRRPIATRITMQSSLDSMIESDRGFEAMAFARWANEIESTHHLGFNSSSLRVASGSTDRSTFIASSTVDRTAFSRSSGVTARYSA